MARKYRHGPYQRRSDRHAPAHKTGDEATIGHDRELDATGLRCPLPVLRLKKIMSAMERGKVLHVIATDPCSVGNILAFVSITGDQMQILREEAGLYHFFIRKA